MAKTQRSIASGLLRKLSGLGSPLDPSVAEEVELPKVGITQAGPVYGNIIFDLEDGRAAYIFGLDLINHTSRPIYGPEFELRRAWQDPDFEWLPDPWAPYRHGHHCYYSFPGKGAPEFPRSEVLNHLLLSENGVLQPRILYKGCLLAIGGPMPKHLRHGDDVEATLVVSIPDHTEFVEPILLFADRFAAKPKPRARERVAFTKVQTEASSYPWSANRSAPIPALLRVSCDRAAFIGSLTPKPPRAGHENR